MSYLTKIKLAIAAVLAAVNAWLGALAMPVYIMMAASLIDYLTGLAVAPARAEKLSSYKGIRGIVKKVCMWALVAVGVMVDLLLGYVGLTLPAGVSMATVVAVWVAANELLSILENAADIGIPLPRNLVKLVAQIKDSVEGEGTDDGV